MSATGSITRQVQQAIEEGEGILRLAPTWVPRSYLVPGRRLKLAERDLYAYGADRGGIDERWLASTTFAMNEGRTPDEGLSFVVSPGGRFTLKEAVEAEGERLVGKTIWSKYKRWPVYSKFFDNLGPIPHHLHQSEDQAKLVGEKANRRVTTSLRISTPPLATSRTHTLDSNPAPPRTTFATVWPAGTKATTTFSVSRRLISWCPERDGWCQPACCTRRLVAYL